MGSTTAPDMFTSPEVPVLLPVLLPPAPPPPVVGSGLTVMVMTEGVPMPSAFLGVTRYQALREVAVGLPVIAQLVVLNTRPAGSVALMVQLTKAEPRAQVYRLPSKVLAGAVAVAGAAAGVAVVFVTVVLVAVEFVAVVLVAVVLVAVVLVVALVVVVDMLGTGAAAVEGAGAALVMVVVDPSVKFREDRLYPQLVGSRSVAARFRYAGATEAPTALVGVTLYVVTLGDMTVGVPLILQVVVLKDNPVGSVEGEMAQLTIGEPEPQLSELGAMPAAFAG